MTPSKTRIASLLVGIAACGLAMVGLPGCKSPSSPEVDTITFIVTNDCGAAVDVFWNGVQQLSLEQGAQGAIPNPTLGTHIVSAKVKESGAQVVSASMDIQKPGEYYFKIEGPSTIRVTNTYGEILSITFNGTFLGEIADNLTHTLRKIRFGDYAFEARVKNSQTVVASTSIKVNDVGEYSWVITR